MRRRVGLAYCGSDPTGSGDLAHDVSRLKGVDSQWLRSGGQAASLPGGRGRRTELRAVRTRRSVLTQSKYLSGKEIRKINNPVRWVIHKPEMFTIQTFRIFLDTLYNQILQIFDRYHKININFQSSKQTTKWCQQFRQFICFDSTN